jgi:multidrug efflux pump subunit AcrB
MLNIASRARPYFGAVLLTVVLLTAGGIYSATRMPMGVYPEVTFPRIAVVARVPGLAVPNMEVQVTRPIEQEVSSVIGAARVRSKSIRGASEIHIDFDPSTDMRWAKTDTWNRINAIRSQLPPEVELTVEQMTPSINPILSVVLTGGDNPGQLRDYAFYQLAPQIKNVPDVLYANVAGGNLREIEVEARPDDLLAAGLSAADLADQIAKVHRLQPAGRIEQQPIAFQVLVNTQGQTARDIADLIISTKSNQPLRVRDVADVRVGHQDRLLSIGFEGKDAVVISVFRRLGGNTVNISRDIAKLLDKTGLSLAPGAKGKPSPRNIQATVVYDQATFVQTAVNNVRDAIILGGLFSVLILLAFLRSWRATLISTLAIPTTLAITFLFLHWAGETLNLMSLGGLAVAIGLIIDDTVVVMENIARHLAPRTGSSPSRAEGSKVDPVDAASSEITGAVIGSTLTTVLVFLPLAFIVGVYGQFFASLSWSLAIAVLVSMVISLTLVPVAAAKFLAGRPMPEPGPIYRFLANGYEMLLSVALKFPWVSLAFSLAAVVAGVILYTGIPGPKKEGKEPQAKQEGTAPEAKEKEKASEPRLKGLQTGLMPAMDEGAFIFDYLAPSGTPLAQTEEMVRDVEHILSENPDVQSYVRRTGAELGLFATQTNRGDIQVILRPDEDDPISLFKKRVRPPFADVETELKERGMKLDEDGKKYIRQKYRRRPVAKVMEEIEDEVKEHFSEHQLKIDLIQIMQDELNDLSGANKPVEVKIFGPDYKQLRDLAEKVGDKLKKNGKGRGFKEVNSGVREGNPDLMVEIDGPQATRMGLTPEAVERQLKVMYSGQVATKLRESAERITDVRVRYPDAVRFGPGRFDPQRVLNQLILLPEPPAGSPGALPDVSPVPILQGPDRAQPLAAVARLKPVRTPEEQWRENQQPAIFVSSEQNEEEAGLGAMVADIRNWLGEMEKAGAFPPRYHWELGGHYIQQQDAFRSLFIVMIVAIFLVFIMLAFQFGSIVLPLLIFLTQPLSLVSGLFALWLTNTPLNVSSYMGAILLIGLDMKNGILLVEYIQQLRREGMELRPALLLAGRTRFRPILMTSLAAILGLFPLALGIGPGAQMQQPLAIMVIGGLTANMLFTRVIIPVGYLVLERKRKVEVVK